MPHDREHPLDGPHPTEAQIWRGSSRRRDLVPGGVSRSPVATAGRLRPRRAVARRRLGGHWGTDR